MINVIFGIIAGCGAALGLGGGTILILLLNFFTMLPQQIIQGINLIFFIPTSIVAIIMNFKNKIIDFDKSKKLIISGIVGAVIGAIIAGKVDSKNLKKYFGMFLIIIAIRRNNYLYFTVYKKQKR